MPDLDAQSRAFRENTDHVADAELAAEAEIVHPAATSLAGIALPEDHEAAQWDAGRVGPKSIAEAREALADRIDDPTAPDDARSAGAYDGLGD